MLLDLLARIRNAKSLKLKKKTRAKKYKNCFPPYKHTWFAETERNVGESRVYISRFMRNHGPGGRSVP